MPTYFLGDGEVKLLLRQGNRATVMIGGEIFDIPISQDSQSLPYVRTSTGTVIYLVSRGVFTNVDQAHAGVFC